MPFYWRTCELTVYLATWLTTSPARMLGTLAPMVDDPDAARLPKGVRTLLRKLSDRHPTAIVSGRSVEKLIQWVNVKGLYFAGSHGFEITGWSSLA